MRNLLSSPQLGAGLAREEFIQSVSFSYDMTTTSLEAKAPHLDRILKTCTYAPASPTTPAMQVAKSNVISE
jgi:hypothetical protein